METGSGSRKGSTSHHPQSIESSKWSYSSTSSRMIIDLENCQSLQPPQLLCSQGTLCNWVTRERPIPSQGTLCHRTDANTWIDRSIHRSHSNRLLCCRRRASDVLYRGLHHVSAGSPCLERRRRCLLLQKESFRRAPRRKIQQRRANIFHEDDLKTKNSCFGTLTFVFPTASTNESPAPRRRLIHLLAPIRDREHVLRR